MADETAKSKATYRRRILADSANAKHRFGFQGEHGSPLTQAGDNTAPKLSDLWFIEFKTVSGLAFEKGVTVDISALAKSVSHISLQTSAMPIDQYGKRIYVPTRVDFPEVTLQMYDTVDGKMFDFSREIYSKFFKNQDAKVTSANAEEILTSAHEHGRKLPHEKHNYYHQHFEKITVYHFFGNLESYSDQRTVGGSKDGKPLPKSAGTGSIQKIELINPLVTSLSFSSSDYSITELRTVDMAVQPENIRIEKTTNVNFPKWMTLGMGYLMHELTSLKQPSTEVYPGDIQTTLDGYDTVNDFEEVFSKEDPRNKDPFKDKWKYENSFSNRDEADPFKDGSFTKTSPIRSREEIDDPDKGHEMKKIDYEKRDRQSAQDDRRKLKELANLYNIAAFGEQGNPHTDQTIEVLTKELKDNIGVIDAARLKKFNTDGGESTFDEGWDFSKTDDKNPTISGFGDLGNSNPPIQGPLPSYTSQQFGSSMINELVSSFFGNRSFNINNTNNSLFGPDGLKNALKGIAINGITSAITGRKLDGSKITDGIITNRTSTKTTSAVIVEKLPDIVETVYKRGSAAPYSPGVSKTFMELQAIKDKFK